MLLTEYARTLDTAPVLQIFATDLDDAAIRAAREGFYPAAIESDVSGAAAALLRARARWLPRAAGVARKRAVRGPRPAQGFALLAARPHFLPESAHLPEPRGAASGARHLPLRLVARQAAVPGLRRIGGRRRHPVLRDRQAAPPVRPPELGAHGSAAARQPGAGRCRPACAAHRAPGTCRAFRRDGSLLRGCRTPRRAGHGRKRHCPGARSTCGCWNSSHRPPSWWMASRTYCTCHLPQAVSWPSMAANSRAT